MAELTYLQAARANLERVVLESAKPSGMSHADVNMNVAIVRAQALLAIGHALETIAQKMEDRRD